MDARRIAQLQALAEQVDTQATQLQAAQDLAGARQRAAARRGGSMRLSR